MIVSVRIFLILLLPLLVRGTGNQHPPKRLSLKATDDRLDAVKLPSGSVYGAYLRAGQLQASIPGDGYYYVPSEPEMDVAKRPDNGILVYVPLSSTRIVRLQGIDIHPLRIPENINAQLHPIPERVNIGKHETVTDADKRLKAILLPPGSAYRYQSSIIPTLIPTIGYYRISPGAIIITPEGNFGLLSDSDKIFRISLNFDVSKLHRIG